MKHRRDVPKFEDKLSQRDDSKTICNNFGSLAIIWQDTKKVLVLHNCHVNTIVKVKRTAKDGSKKNRWPEAISFL